MVTFLIKHMLGDRVVMRQVKALRDGPEIEVNLKDFLAMLGLNGTITLSDKGKYYLEQKFKRRF